ncbi:MAG: prephenate dehydrogenase/arogenate dehydrogenase family protein, partial [Planctomycetes bacterium]|nr:prephenate dehydrogenase/arogenate dehydrogenase family protein [Planctomycetota bacterium]
MGLAARAANLFDEVRGTTRRRSTLKAALAAGAIDRGFSDAAQAAGGADLVVVATAVSTIPAFCLECAAVAREGALITDVGSVKARIDAQVQ